MFTQFSFAAPGRSGSDGDCDDLADVGADSVTLGDEESGHCLVQGRPVHVDGGADGEDKPGDAGIHIVLIKKRNINFRKI